MMRAIIPFCAGCSVLWGMAAVFAVDLPASERDALDAGVRGDVVIIVGSPGTDEYAEAFSRWAGQWQHAAERGDWKIAVLGLSPDRESSLTAIQSLISSLEGPPESPLWIVLIGHGTFDGRTAKFALPGPDLEPEHLQHILKAVPRPTALLLCFSASAPFVPALASPGRIVVSATNSGNEVNYSRFGEFLSQAIGSDEADLDKDEQTSLLEAFLFASRRTEGFYKSAGRLVTEHAVLDDNGDGRPVPLEGFSGLRPVNRDDPRGLLPDGLTAHQWHLVPSEADAALPADVLVRRNAIELEIARLRERRSTLSDADYLRLLKGLLLEMADLLVEEESVETGRPPIPPLPERL